MDSLADSTPAAEGRYPTKSRFGSELVASLGNTLVISSSETGAKSTSRRHVIVLMLWHTGCQVGELRALDLGDLDLDGSRPQGDGPAVHFVHRPDKGTPLKNKGRGERWNAIGAQVAQTLEDYIDGPRVETIDDFGREPLITTKHGRIPRSTVRDNLYRVTRPCWIGEPCPHDRGPAQ